MHFHFIRRSQDCKTNSFYFATVLRSDFDTETQTSQSAEPQVYDRFDNSLNW